MDDAFVPCAAAQISRHSLAHAAVVQFGLAPNEVDRREHHARRAEPALKAMVLTERLLYWMHLATLSQTFDSRDLVVPGLDGKHQAGADRDAVEQDSAGAAYAMLAADVNAGHTEAVTQEIGQKGAGLGDAA